MLYETEQITERTASASHTFNYRKTRQQMSYFRVLTGSCIKIKTKIACQKQKHYFRFQRYCIQHVSFPFDAVALEVREINENRTLIIHHSGKAFQLETVIIHQYLKRLF